VYKRQETFDLEEKVKIGRKYVGDSACVPLAAVFSDMLHAVDDFKKRKKENDPLVQGKEKIVLFMQYGDGPCRQGQYIDVCKLNLYRLFGNSNNKTMKPQNGNLPIKFLTNISTALHNKKDYLTVLENWATVQVYHTIVLNDVLHSIYLKISSNCKNFEEFEKFKLDYKKLKQTVYDIIEYKMKPGKFTQFIVDKIEQRLSKFSGLAKYFCYGFFNNNGIRKIFKEFNRNWIQNNTNGTDLNNEQIKIHIEGEVYLRVAQNEEILKLLIDTLGFNSFDLKYTPMWGYFEYMLEQRVVLVEKEIKMYKNKLNDTYVTGDKDKLLKLIQEGKNKIKETTKIINKLRNVLSRPLYKAAGLDMPHEVKKDLMAAEPILPTLKPEGELVPYVGATISEINDGTDLILNVAPEGCMVASMCEMLTPKITQLINNKNARIQHLSTTDGEVNQDLLRLSLLKLLGPVKYYSRQSTI